MWFFLSSMLLLQGSTTLTMIASVSATLLGVSGERVLLYTHSPGRTIRQRYSPSAASSLRWHRKSQLTRTASRFKGKWLGKTESVRARSVWPGCKKEQVNKCCLPKGKTSPAVSAGDLGFQFLTEEDSYLSNGGKSPGEAEWISEGSHL